MQKRGRSRRPITLDRRAFALAALAVPLAACAKPKTPFAHLYGRGWVSGAYEEYGKTYRALEDDTNAKSFEAYKMIAERGVVALDGLQAREVPFFIRVDASEKGFTVERDLPERLTFRADMSDADRAAAQAAFDKAREHVHTDYDEIQRLDWSLGRLLAQTQRVRAAVENTTLEEYRLAQRVSLVRAGKTPFELPYQVTPADYEEVLLLLLARLEDEKASLEATSGSIVAVGLAVRATDAGSASLAANIRKVLLGVVADAKDAAPVAFPVAAEHDARLARGKTRLDEILASAEYKQFLAREAERPFEEMGAMLALLDRFTGLPTSKVYRVVLDVWRGDRNYFDYLKTVAGMIPHAGELARVIEQGVALTEKVQKAVKLVNEKGATGVKDALVNVGTQYARDQLKKQLVFYKDQRDLKEVEERLADSLLAKLPLPVVPKGDGVTD